MSKSCKQQAENPIRPLEHKRSGGSSEDEAKSSKKVKIQVVSNPSNDGASGDDNIDIPDNLPIPPTPTSEEWIKHQITHMPYKAWCPICVKNAAQNNPHRKIQHMRQTEVFSLDYMYMTSKPTSEELAHPILVIKARISKGVWALPVTRKGPYLSNIVQRVNHVITSLARGAVRKSY